MFVGITALGEGCELVGWGLVGVGGAALLPGSFYLELPSVCYTRMKRIVHGAG